MSSPPDRETLAAQALGKIDAETRAVVPPLHVSTTYLRDPDNRYSSGYSYGRPDNATVRELESIVAMLESATDALAFGSGMSAAIAIFTSLPAGSRVLAPRVMYWALRKWLSEDAVKLGLRIAFVEMTDLAAVQDALQAEETALVWIETPSNPLWSVVDIRQIADLAHAAGAQLAVDSTCATPVLTRPLDFGADIVMHSATKYLNGHSDALAGVLATRSANRLWATIQRTRYTYGMLLGPFEAFLVIRGIRTLHLRVRASCATALDLAQRLQTHPRVAHVLYPGLRAHEGHALAKRQMSGGFGGMLSIRMKGGADAAIAVAARVTLWKRATSLGGVESLIEHRASVEGAGSPCPPDLLRLSCGIETADDLHGDLLQALASPSSS